MCGIIGYAGKTCDSLSTTIKCLKNLEYRGYDSSGVATVENNAIKVFKSVGKIKNLEKVLEGTDIKSSISIAHTRWATHGEPSKVNAHPQKSGKVTLVHNGIIENYAKLRSILWNNGYYFLSETDTEVATSYIDYMCMNSSNIQAINKACKDFEGSFAFGILFSDEKDTIYATRKDSPLVIGISDNGNFIASDVSAILEYTNKYILLEDYEIAKITKDNVIVYDKNLNVVEKEIKLALWDATKYQKAGYDHFMLKEIHEQPSVLSKLFKNLKNMDKDIVDFKSIQEIHIVACGSAMHAGMVGKYLFENLANIKTQVEIASEYRYKENFLTPSTLVIIISQSGETADTLASLRLTNKKGANTLAIVNVAGSSIAREAKKVIYTNAGPEIAVATTKGYTSQIAVLDSLVLLAMLQKGIISKDKLDDVYNSFNLFFENAEKVIASPNYLEIAKKLYTHNYSFYIGRGVDYASAMEGSLKLKEISYIHSEAYAAGELKHGTISLIEPGTTIVFAIATNNSLVSKTLSNLKETKARGAYTILITTSAQDTSHISSDVDDVITLPYINDFTTPLFVALALQLIAYETAKLKGTDIDKPKNLAKSVTVE